MTRRASIKSIGIHLPPERRANDWWPQHVLDAWRARREKNPFRDKEAGDQPETRGMQLALDAMTALKDDPFMGVRERRVRADGVKPSHMELAAARDAIARAGIDVKDIGAIFTSSHGPDTLLVANAALLHRELGLPARCIATGIDSVCNAFAFQLLYAEQLVASGRVRYALLTQSSTVRSLFPIDHPMMPLLGEAATAVVVGADDECGVLATHFETDGTQYEFILIGNPDGPWYETAPTIYGDKRLARRGSMMLGDQIAGVTKAALAQAQIAPRDVHFIATHQGQGWIRRVVQELVDAPQAVAHDTFPWTGTVGGSNVPLCMGLAERNGQLKRGDIVACGMGGVGVTLAGVVLRFEGSGAGTPP